ncbi:hypothetical protein JG688_00017270, partial [Phytophthora aleatoria]
MLVRCESCAGTWKTKSGFAKEGLGPTKRTQILFFNPISEGHLFHSRAPAPSTHSRINLPELKRGRQRGRHLQERQLTDYRVFLTFAPLPVTTL